MNTLSDQIFNETRKLQWAVSPDFYAPDYNRSIQLTLPTMYQVLGKALPEGMGELPTLLPFLPEGVPGHAKRVLLLTVDALGYKELEQSPGFCRVYQEFGTWVTSVFPTITSVALTSIYTAQEPALHGVNGHLIWKDAPGAVVDMLKMHVVGAGASLSDAGFDVNIWKNTPGLLDLTNGLMAKHLMPQEIVYSGLSTYSYGRVPIEGYVHFLEGFAKAGRMLTDTPQGWVGLYTPLVDTMSHVEGGNSEGVGQAVRQVENALSTMLAGLSSEVVESTVVMVVADHGQNDIETKIPLYGDTLAFLEANSRGLGFSGRVMHVYLKGERQEEARVAGMLRELVGEMGEVFPFETVRPLVGGHCPDEKNLRRSLGDLVVLLRPGFNWERRPPNPDASPYATTLVSQHGSLGWEELFVPFIVAPAAAFIP